MNLGEISIISMQNVCSCERYRTTMVKFTNKLYMFTFSVFFYASLAIQNEPSEVSDQTARMRTLI